MSTGLVLGVVGGIAGSFVGMPQLGFAIGSAVGGYIDYSNQPDTEGPRLDDTKVSDSAYGKVVPRIWGRYRTATSLIWSMPLKEVRSEEDVEGGKGGGPKQISYSYYFTGAVALAEAPEGGIAGIGKIWVNGELVFDATPRAEEATDYGSMDFDITQFMRLHRGAWDQGRDPRMEAEDPDCSAYRGIAYLFFEDLPLASYNNRIPNVEVEVICGTVRAPLPEVIKQPELLCFLDDGGSQAPGRVMVKAKKNYVSFSMGLMMDATGGYTTPKSFKLFSMRPRKPPAVLRGKACAEVRSYLVGTSDEVLFGPYIQPSTPLDRRGNDSIADFSIVGNNALYGWGRAGDRLGTVTEVFMSNPAETISVYNPRNAQSVLGSDRYPFLAVDMDQEFFFITNTSRHKLFGLFTPPPTEEIPHPPFNLHVLHEFASGEVVTAFAKHSSMPQLFAATSAGGGATARVYVMSNATAPILTSVAHPGGGVISMYFARDGWLYTTRTATAAEVGAGAIARAVQRWKPGMPAFEFVCYVRSQWAIAADAGDYLGSARGKTAKFGPAGSQGTEFFYTDGKRMIFGASVGLGSNDGIGGEGIAGAIISPENDFGADIHDVTVGDIVADICRSCGLQDSEFDVSELDEPVFGYCSARRTTGRANVDPLRAYFPFDAVESGDKIYFRTRGRDGIAVIVDEDLGAGHES